MALSFLYLSLIAVFAVQGSKAITIPIKVSDNGGACLSADQQAEVRRQLADEAIAAITPGLTEENPASSCSAIPAGRPSGYYWILPATGPPAVRVYCDFNRQCGCVGPSTWTRVAFLNMTDTSQNCPDGWFFYASPRSCGRGRLNDGCISVIFPTHGQLFSRVCGRVLGYQNFFTTAFSNLLGQRSIDQNYLHGVSLTHGPAGSRQHIWSFASALKSGTTVFHL